jgi:hypothetical protein
LNKTCGISGKEFVRKEIRTYSVKGVRRGLGNSIGGAEFFAKRFTVNLNRKVMFIEFGMFL